MKTTFFAIMVVCACTNLYAKEFLTENVVMLEKVKTWDNAKKACKDSGDNWRLPMSHMELLTIADLGKRMPVVQLNRINITGGMNIYEGNIYPLWISISDKVDNKYLKGTSNVAYMQNGKGTDVEKLDISQSVMSQYLEQAEIYKNELLSKENFRTPDEVAFLNNEINVVNEKLIKNGQYAIRVDLNEQSERSELSEKANAIFKKADAKRHEMAIENLEKTAEFFKDGLEVICVK